MNPPITALLLAAGRGERMRPLTDRCPKPLLEVHRKPLLQWHLEALARAGCQAAVVNTAWLGDQIEARFGEVFHGASPLALRYSHEGRDFGAALETAGGIVRALPFMADVFWVAAGDVFVPDFVFDPAAVAAFAASGRLAHIWLVPNPAHNPDGDFGLSAQGLALNLPKREATAGLQALHRHTFSTIALYRRAFFEADGCPIAHGNPTGQRAPLAPLLRAAMDAGQVSATLYSGAWTDVGTPERLAELNRAFE
jgi:MurNAc alpha-1-phosphate uridylyltransferase